MIGPGTQVAGCVLERELGRGGMGVVYLARHEALDRPVALKLLALTMAQDPAWLARFRREARAQAAVEHPNILPVYDAGTSELGPYIVMRYVEGGSLDDLLKAGTPPAQTLAICRQVAQALEALHTRDLVHRDVKPANVLVQDGHHAWLADFGLGRPLEATAVTATGGIVGTPAFISPEGVRGERTGPAADVYALAVMLFMCLCGAPPFAGRRHAALLIAHMSEMPPAPRELRPELPVGVDAALLPGMAKDPADRPGAVELVDAVIAAMGAAPEITTESTIPLRDIPTALLGAAAVAEADTSPWDEPPVPAELAPGAIASVVVSEPGPVTPVTPVAPDTDAEAATPQGGGAPEEPGGASLEHPHSAAGAAADGRRRPPPGTVRVAALAGLALAPLAGIGAGVAAAGDDGGSPVVARAGALSITAPAGWARTGTVGDADWEDVVVLAPGGRTSAGALVVGRAPARTGTLMPAGLEADGDGELLRLGDVELRRHPEARLAGIGAPVEASVMEGERSLVAAACVPGAGRATAPGEGCDAALATLAVADEELEPAAIDPAWSAATGRAIRRFASARARARTALQRARTRTLYAREASALGDVARGLAGAELPAAGPLEAVRAAALRAAAKAVASAYRDLARAAVRDPARSGAARNAVRRAESELSEVVAGL